MAAIEVHLPEYHDKQQEMSDALRDAWYLVAMCGRRFGKSIFEYTELAECAIDGNPVALFAPAYKYAMEGWRWFISHLSPIITSANKTEMRIELAGGGSIDVWTLDSPDAGRSRHYRLIVIDEAGLVRDLMQCWTAAILPTLADYDGKAIIGGTPKGAGEFDKLFQNEGLGKKRWRSFRFMTADNPNISPDVIKAIGENMPESVRKQELEGIPDDDGGNPFGLAAIDDCIESLSSSPVVAWGIDLAKYQDWTVIVGLDAEGRVAEFHRFNMIDWDVQEERIHEIIGSTVTVIDASGVGDPVVERLQRRNRRVRGFKFSGPSKQDLMRKLQVAIHRREVAFPDNEIAAELRTFIYEYNPRSGNVKYEAANGYHDDCVMALALAIEAKGEARAGISKATVVRSKANSWEMGRRPRSKSPLFGAR